MSMNIKANSENDNPFKPNTSRVDRLETQILILMQIDLITAQIKDGNLCS